MKRISLLALALTLTACTGGKKKEFWIYTSSYKEVLPLYEEPLKKAFPEVQFRFFQAGSENVAAKVTAELAGGGTQADLIMTADLFFFMELKKQGALLPLEKVGNLAKLPAQYHDADLTYIVNRFPVMGIAVNVDRFKDPKDRPTSFKSLLEPKYKGLLTMPSPMESGTALTTALYFKSMFGDSYFSDLRKQDILASGGNGAVMARVQSGERPVGIILMENILQAKARGQQNVEFILPAEGALAMPSPIALLKSTKDPLLARRVMDWFMGPEAQDVLLASNVYSPLPGVAAPKGAPAWSAIKFQSWDLKLFETWSAQKQGVKELFQRTVLK